jgi:hypothetical protein
MRILLTNNTLGPLQGTEMYIYDVALELQRRGHTPIAFSTRLGEVAKMLNAATVPVIDKLEDCGEPPDIIHGQHHYETLAAALYFPGAPVKKNHCCFRVCSGTWRSMRRAANGWSTTLESTRSG